MLNLLRKLWNSPFGPSAPIRRPTGLSRRDFLRSMGVTSVTVAMGGGMALWQPPGRGRVYGARGEVLRPQQAQDKFLEFYAYQTQGMSIGHTAALARIEFDAPPLAAAVDAVNKFTRRKMAEDGFFRKIMPQMSLINDGLERHIVKWGVDEIDEQTRREIMQIGWKS